MKKQHAGIENFEFNGLPALRLTTGSGASAVISLYGAQLLSWMPLPGSERLYLSERARFCQGQAIRGGVPVVFPQFGERGSLPKHGFARTRLWRVADLQQTDRYACATLRLDDCAATRALWPHAFIAELTVMIEGKRLDIELDVRNSGASAFSFTAALHSYFRVGKVDMCRLQGLDGCSYLDLRDGGKLRREHNEALAFEEEIDRCYLDVRKPLLLWEPARHLAIEMEGFRDCVVWNPWLDKGAQLADMPPAGYRQMLCVEAASVARPLELAPGAHWLGRQTATVV